MTRVGYFCLESRWPFHLAHELDLMEEDLEAGHEVHVVEPGRSLPYSDTAPWANYAERLPGELSRLRNGLALLSGEVRRHSVDRLLGAQGGAVPVPEWEPVPGGHEGLNSLSFEGHDCGNAVLSSLIWHTRNTAVDLVAHAAWVRRALESSIKVYRAAKAFIGQWRPARVYVFNGRMAMFRGVLRAAQELGVECLVHERGATLDRVGLTPNTMPHDTSWLQQEILRHWEGSRDDEGTKREIGGAFYRKKRDRHVFNWIAYTRQQAADLLPPGLDRGRPVYSIFTSSEYERFALPQYYRYLLHSTQLEGIADVVSMLEEGGFGGTLCVRLHPNSHNELPSLLDGLKERVSGDWVKVVPADSPVDTYALLDASDKVVTFGSTMAMEAAHWGKPVVSFATNPYQNLDATYEPSDRGDAVRLLTGPLLPKGGVNCLKYGYFYSTFGRTLRYAKADGLTMATFKGKYIGESGLGTRVLKKYHKLRRRLRNAMRSAPNEEPLPGDKNRRL